MADRILVVEDEEAISELIEMNLTVAGYEVVQVYDGGKVEEVLKQEAGFDLALVDVMLPGRDGFSLMEVMKRFRIPVIYLTAKTDVGSKVRGLRSGAEDYIVKPFDSEVLILKIKAILSRSKHEEAEPKPKFITIGEYVFNTELRTITKNEEQIKLTPKEARLLELLYNYKDGLLPREKALTEIWGTNDYFTARSMDVYVTKLRKYFKDDQNIKIENVHGSGFRLVIEE